MSEGMACKQGSRNLYGACPQFPGTQGNMARLNSVPEARLLLTRDGSQGLSSTSLHSICFYTKVLQGKCLDMQIAAEVSHPVMGWPALPGWSLWHITAHGG